MQKDMLFRTVVYPWYAPSQHQFTTHFYCQVLSIKSNIRQVVTLSTQKIRSGGNGNPFVAEKPWIVGNPGKVPPLHFKNHAPSQFPFLKTQETPLKAALSL
jgi:hypothetical protein